ncbi:hypothetical protein [Gluconacetobacter dulcium]|uniref:hypothetical protein n=1 Tax=Gluconacetobacter dulcium TaxID=2729096 RepID=UPI001C7EC63F|nr:hypothetical protein [Gluconacetobacter dulcium]
MLKIGRLPATCGRVVFPRFMVGMAGIRSLCEYLKTARRGGVMAQGRARLDTQLPCN